MRPDLFAAVVANMPFVDVIGTGSDETPYDNVRPQPYADMLVHAAWSDTEVPYSDPSRWVAKLRATKTGDNLLLLRTFMDAGHDGPSGRDAYLHAEAFILAFLLDRLGVEGVRPSLPMVPCSHRG